MNIYDRQRQQLINQYASQGGAGTGERSRTLAPNLYWDQKASQDAQFQRERGITPNMDPNSRRMIENQMYGESLANLQYQSDLYEQRQAEARAREMQKLEDEERREQIAMYRGRRDKIRKARIEMGGLLN